jgi:hypothetical protein
MIHSLILTYDKSVMFGIFQYILLLCNNYDHEITVTCRGLRVTYKTGFGLDDWVYCALYIHNSVL